MRQRMGRRETGRRRKPSLVSVARLVLMLAAVVLLVIAGVKLVDYLAQGARTRETQAQLQRINQEAQFTPSPEAVVAALATPAPESGPPVEEPKPAALPLPTQGAPILNELIPLYSKNRDTAGWLKSDLIQEIDFPILHRDNVHYVSHDFNNRSNVAGWVFLDESNSILPQDQNLVLHGHNMKNGTMFGKLTRFLSPQSMAAGPLFTFSTLYHTQTYVPYAVSLSSIDPASPQYFNFLQPNFRDEEALIQYSDWLRQHSRLILPVDVRGDDRLLTLVTCHGNESSERLILALRALRPDETREAILARFTLPSSSN